MSGTDAIWLVAALAAGILFELVKVRKALERIEQLAYKPGILHECLDVLKEIRSK